MDADPITQDFANPENPVFLAKSEDLMASEGLLMGAGMVDARLPGPYDARQRMCQPSGPETGLKFADCNHSLSIDRASASPRFDDEHEHRFTEHEHD